MSRTIVGLIFILVALSLVPLVLIARSRARTSPNPAPHPILDMDKQAKFRPQRPSGLFADGRIMRPRIEGTLAREDLLLDNEPLIDPNGIRMVDNDQRPLLLDREEDYARVVLGQEKGPDGKPRFIARVPIAVTADVMLRGQERFNIYCAPCHGMSGYGNGPVAQRATQFQESGSEAAVDWRPPTNYHTDGVRSQPDGQIFNTITNGIRKMPRYDKQISVRDRWAIVAYVRALERSQQVRPAAPTAQPAASAGSAPASPS